jgi:hypothetical protein
MKDKENVCSARNGHSEHTCQAVSSRTANTRLQTGIDCSKLDIEIERNWSMWTARQRGGQETGRAEQMK